VVDGKQVHIPAPPGGGYRDGVTQEDIYAGRWLSLFLIVGLGYRKIRNPYDGGLGGVRLSCEGVDSILPGKTSKRETG